MRIQTVPTAPTPGNVLCPGFVFVDVESSGLHETSYPIEVGWSDDGLNAQSFLIRPCREWGVADWTHGAEQIHGIPRARLMEEGIDVREAAERLAVALAGKTIFSDDLMDRHWLERLFEAAEMKFQHNLHQDVLALALHLRPGYGDVPVLLRQRTQAEDLASVHYPSMHRAGQGAAHIAAVFRMTVDRDFFGTVLDHHDRHAAAPGAPDLT